MIWARQLTMTQTAVGGIGWGAVEDVLRKVGIRSSTNAFFLTRNFLLRTCVQSRLSRL